MTRRGIKKRIRDIVERRDNYRCKYCGGPATTLDHVIALKRGGKSTVDNLVACCEDCNTAKGHMSKRDWEKRLERLGIGELAGSLLGLGVSALPPAGVKP